MEIIRNNGKRYDLTLDLGSLGSETDPIWIADKPNYLTIASASTSYYPLIGNPSGFLSDAPSDGTLYGRKNGIWTSVSVGAESDPVFTAWLSSPPNISIFTNDSGYITSYTETDPIWLADKPSYLTIASAAATYSIIGHTHTFASLTSKPTTLAGYGITDAYPLLGNPSGFLTVESDPDFWASDAATITSADISNWNTAYTWGNHAIAGYLTSISGLNISLLTNDSGYITSSALSPYLTSATAASTYEPIISTLSISKGGTNSGTALSNNRVMVSNSGAIKEAAAITAAHALISDANGIPTQSSVTSTELAYLSGTTEDQLKDNVAVLGAKALATSYRLCANPVHYGFGNITTTFSMTSTQMRVLGVYLSVARTVTGVVWYQATQGNYTANNYNGIGLYSYNSGTGTCTLVASLANDGNIWKVASNNYNSAIFSSSYSAQPGLYFIGILYCSSAQTTAPVLGAAPSFSNAAMATFDPAIGAKICGSIASRTSLPASFSISSVTQQTNNIWLGLIY